MPRGVGGQRRSVDLSQRLLYGIDLDIGQRGDGVPAIVRAKGALGEAEVGGKPSEEQIRGPELAVEAYEVSGLGPHEEVEAVEAIFGEAAGDGGDRAGDALGTQGRLQGGNGGAGAGLRERAVGILARAEEQGHG